MIEKESSDIHIILHDHPEPPRLLVISKNSLRRFLITLPLGIVAVVALSLGLGLWWKTPQVTGQVRLPSLPGTYETTSNNSSDAEAELRAVKLAQVAMQNKLAQTTTTESELWLGPVKKPYALQDLTAKNPLKLESIALEDGAGKRVLRFNLINTGSPEDRVTGHVFVFQVDNRGLAPYPAMTAQELLEGIRYNKGESFAVARLRPVEAPFPPADSDSRFLVIVFNREGDLLIRQELTGPFKASGQ
jgi:hypothetical protein